MKSSDKPNYSRYSIEAKREAQRETLRAIAEAYSENEFHYKRTRMDIRIHFDLTEKTAYITDWQGYDVFLPHVGIALSKNILRDMYAFFTNHTPKKDSRTQYRIDVACNDFEVISDAFTLNEQRNDYEYFKSSRREYYYWLYDFLYEQIDGVHNLSFNHKPLIRLKNEYHKY